MREWGPEEGLWGFLLGFVVGVRESSCCLTAEAVQGAALAFEGVDHVHGGHRLPLRVLGVGDGVTDHVLQEHFEDTTGLLVDQAGDTLDTTTACQTTDSGLGDTLDVITKHLPVTLGATLSKSLSSFTATRHVVCVVSTNATNPTRLSRLFIPF